MPRKNQMAKKDMKMMLAIGGGLLAAGMLAIRAGASKVATLNTAPRTGQVIVSVDYFDGATAQGVPISEWTPFTLGVTAAIARDVYGASDVVVDAPILEGDKWKAVVRFKSPEPLAAGAHPLSGMEGVALLVG